MPSSSPVSPFESVDEICWCRGTSAVGKQLFDIGQFVRGLGARMRHGQLTRAPLRLLRLQLRENVAECDWLARPPDPWDSRLRLDIGQRHASLQALKDAVDVRSLLFTMLLDVDAAYLRVYRQSPVDSREAVISGYVNRNSPSFRNVRSIAMRAKLLGFRFSLEDEVLRPSRELANMELVDW